MLPDFVRLSVGTFTAVPVPPPRSVTPQTSGRSIVFAPIAVVPLALLAAVLGWLGQQLQLAPLAVAAVVVGTVALGNRGFHLDGLADVADGLAASYDRERSLAVMKTGDVGPAGTATVVLVLVVQIAAAASVLAHVWGPVVVGLAVIVSRGAAMLGCLRGLKPARPDGLAAAVVGTVSPWAAVLSWSSIAALLVVGVFLLDEPLWRGPVAVVLGLGVVGLLVWRCSKRFEGLVGDVLGASVEVMFAVLLLALS